MLRTLYPFVFPACLTLFKSTPGFLPTIPYNTYHCISYSVYAHKVHIYICMFCIPHFLFHFGCNPYRSYFFQQEFSTKFTFIFWYGSDGGYNGIYYISPQYFRFLQILGRKFRLKA